MDFQMFFAPDGRPGAREPAVTYRSSKPCRLAPGETAR